MNLIVTFRSKTSKQGRTVFALFAAVWLALILQPCAMAAPGTIETPGHGVAHTDSGRAHSVAGQDSGNEDCPHDSLSEAGCCDANGICDEFEALKRSAAVKIKDLSSEPFAYISPLPSAPDLASDLQRLHYFAYEEQLPAGPSLNIRYCVYLK